MALQADPLQLHVHEVAAQLVERAERLIEQQDGGLGDQHPANRRALRHPAGELARIDGLEPRQADEIEELTGRVMLGVGCRLAVADLNGQHDVLDRGPPGEQCRLLKHHADIAARPHHRLAFENDAAARRRLQAGHDLEQGRFSAARSAR